MGLLDVRVQYTTTRTVTFKHTHTHHARASRAHATHQLSTIGVITTGPILIDHRQLDDLSVGSGRR